MLVAQLFQGGSGWDGFPGVDVEGAHLGFGRGGHDRLDNLGDGEDGPVVGGVFAVI